MVKLEFYSQDPEFESYPLYYSWTANVMLGESQERLEEESKVVYIDSTISYLGNVGNYNPRLLT